MSLWSKIAVIAAVAGPVVVVDQLTKAAARETLAHGQPVEILPFLNVRLGFNPGISFGFLPAEGSLAVAGLIGFTAALVLILAVWSIRTGDPRERLSLSLIGGGAVGNLMDRVRDGMVTDFIDLHAAGHHWPTFNGADIAITLGAAYLIAASMFPRTQNKEALSGR